MTVAAPPQTVGELLRTWRERRRLTQLELALQAEVSTRHLSFAETGRASPSRDMILHLADELDVPLRERNQLLLAGGYAPAYPQAAALDAPQLGAVHTAVHDILTAHEPNPAVVVDRHWNVVDANSGLSIFTDRVAPELLAPPVNVMRLSLHPGGAAPYILNLNQWRSHLLRRLRREIAQTADPELVRLYEEVRAYAPEAWAEVDMPGPGEVVVPLRFGAPDEELAFFSTVAAFGTPLDITVAELAIELFFPADPSTADALRRRKIRPAPIPDG